VSDIKVIWANKDDDDDDDDSTVTVIFAITWAVNNYTIRTEPHIFWTEPNQVHSEPNPSLKKRTEIKNLFRTSLLVNIVVTTYVADSEPVSSPAGLK